VLATGNAIAIRIISALQDRLVHQVEQDLMARLEHPEKPEFQGRIRHPSRIQTVHDQVDHHRQNPVATVQPDHPVNQALEDKRDHLALRVNPEKAVGKDHLDPRVHLAHPAPMANLVRKVHQVKTQQAERERRDPRDYLEEQDLEDPRDHLDLLPLGQLLLDNQGHQDHPVDQEVLEVPEIKAHKAHLAILDPTLNTALAQREAMAAPAWSIADARSPFCAISTKFNDLIGKN